MSRYFVENEKHRIPCKDVFEAAQVAVTYANSDRLRTYCFLEHEDQKLEQFSVVPAAYKCEASMGP